jgi:hypothetical protein
MPYGNNPNGIIFGFIKKPIRGYNDLPVGKFRKLRYDSSGFGEILEPSQDFFSPVPKIDGSRRFILSNI